MGMIVEGMGRGGEASRGKGEREEECFGAKLVERGRRYTRNCGESCAGK